ncbi:ABC transporter permease [Nocardioides sp. DS6]|uniref:ABC transporter permease n=1 Tax=Nocardioides eburneus TaxID=3231482 RepID=A0ABV3T0Y6_9ACTN
MTGTVRLVRAALRRDRWLVLWWTVGLVALYWVTAVSIPQTYTSQHALDQAAAALDGNPAYVAMAGPTRALDTVGGQVAWQVQAFGAVLVGVMAMFVVVRHTRAEEEAGRDELVRAAPVGRLAPAVSGVTVSLVVSVVAGVLSALAVASTGLDPADSFGLGLGLAGCGAVFTAGSYVAAQVAGTARGAYGLAGGAVGAAYALRAVGDVGAPVLSWLSPIGWYEQLHAFSGLRWWPLAVIVVAAAGTLVLGGWLLGRRDYGDGLRPVSAGPADGRLRGGLGLAVRLQRGSVIGWAGGLFLGGLAYGAIGNDVGDVIGDSQAVTDMLAQGGVSLVDGFYGTAAVMLAVIAAGFAVSSANRPWHEEEAGHAEILLVTRLPRRSWLLGHTVVTVAGTIIVLGAAGVGLGGGYVLTTREAGHALRIGASVLEYIPAVLVVAAVARFLHGWAPRWLPVAWLPVVYAGVVVFFADLLRFPGWLRGLSPFDRLALAPAEPVRWLPIVLLAVVAAALSVAGQAGLGRRDIG